MAAPSPDDRQTLPAVAQSALLVEDPDLALGIPAAERELAERLVLVPLLERPAGPLVLPDAPGEPSLGVLMLEGFATATTTFAEQSTDQLIGPGHVMFVGADHDDVLPVFHAHEAVSPVRLAVLDRRFIAAARRWPALLIALHDRLRAQQRRLAVHGAIGRMRRNEDRILAVLWQVAEQWGHVTAEGVVVPVRLTHEAVGRVAGASRPTTSLALAALEREGRLRRAGGSRLILDPDTSMIRRRAVDRAPLRPRPARIAALTPPLAGIDRAALLERVAALHGAFDDKVRNVEEVLAASRASSARNAETRRLLRLEREPEG